MKRNNLITYCLLIVWLLSPVANLQADNLTQAISIVPYPTQLVPGSGTFLFSPKTTFVVENNEQAEVAQLFTSLFTQAAGFTPKVKLNSKKGDVRFVTDRSLKSEAYLLDVTPQGIVITASDGKGFFYGLQTIRQLLPAAIESMKVATGIRWAIPALTVKDEPRFGYRGLMLDAVRCFIPKENVLRIIDCMAMLKVNKFHFHLTDDNGWRLEIKKHPRLTEIGAWRVDRTDVPFPERRNQLLGEPTPIGGFYTHEDIREIVAYATQRQIEVIPEIEMPGHAMAFLASYPQLACPVVKQFIGVVPGMGGGYDGIIHCAGNDSVFTVLQDVIDEVTELFPSEFIHVGGDEAVKIQWEKCPLCQARMKKENLATEEDLQGYFMQRVADYVHSKGKEIIGWDELTNTAIPQGTVIMGWRVMGEAAEIAAKLGHRFIMTPARIMYLIRYQGPQWFEPVTYFGNNTLKDVYDYEPIQPGWTPEVTSLLMGIQASMWTEFCDKPADAEYLLFPRLAALAEGAWSQPEQKNWARFLKGMDTYNAHVAEKGIVYARSMYNIQHTVVAENGQLEVQLECIRPDVAIRYTIDGSEPTAQSTLYEKRVRVGEAKTIKSATFAQDKQVGQTLVLPLLKNKATAKPILERNASEKLLVNGVRGSLKQSDFEWCAWAESDTVSFTVDLLQEENLKALTLGCLTNNGMAIHKPSAIEVWLSADNRDYRKAAEVAYTPEDIFRVGSYKEDCLLKLNDAKARYVRVIARGAGMCPPDNVRPAVEARVLLDEVIIE